MKTDTVGNPIFSFEDLFEVMHSGKTTELFSLDCEPHAEVERFNKVSIGRHQPGLSIYRDSFQSHEEVDQMNQNIWFIPVEYQEMDVREVLLGRCQNQEERDRTTVELDEYESRGMFPILKCMSYLVDYMQSQDIVYGVGRGSSVASMVLYLIGVHRINPLEYDLDFNEFMRGE